MRAIARWLVIKRGREHNTKAQSRSDKSGVGTNRAVHGWDESTWLEAQANNSTVTKTKARQDNRGRPQRQIAEAGKQKNERANDDSTTRRDTNKLDD